MLIAPIAGFCAGVSAAMAVKLASSIDDVLWLSTFLTPQTSKLVRVQNAITYASVCLLQTCLAYILSQFGQSVLDNIMGGADDERMSTDRLLTLVSGGALLVYSVVLGVDYYQENFGDERYKCVERSGSLEGNETVEDAGDHNGAVNNVSIHTGNDLDIELPKVSTQFAALELEDDYHEDGSDGEEDDDDDPAAPPFNKKSRPLAIIAFLGSLDDLTLFVPMLVGKTFGIFELIVGAMIATLLIVIMCVCLTSCKVVADFLERIPLVAIVATFAIILLLKGIVFMD
jgi:hypothetical protein